MRLYHRTSAQAALAILAIGFKDGIGRYLTDRQHGGVWLSDLPLDEHEGASGQVRLAVDLDVSDEQLATYERVQEPSFGYREFLIPAELVNVLCTVTVDDWEEDPLVLC